MIDESVNNNSNEVSRPKPEGRGDKIKKEILDYLKMLVIVAAIVLVLNQLVLINARIPSESMENTIMTKDQIFGNRLAYKFSDPERFDIIIFKYPDDEKQLFIKRIIGLPGETVTIRDGGVYINDSKEPLDDSFIKEPMLTTSVLQYTVPEESYFVMGDNRNDSLDSRYWTNTFVRKDKILGKAMLRYLPLNKIGFIK